MKSTAIFAAAILMVAGFNLPAANAASGPATAPSRMEANASITNKAESVAPDMQIQKVIASATKYALTPKDMNKLVSLFPEAQRQSIEKSSSFSEGYGDKLNSRIESISKAWKQKYDSSFSISKDSSFLSITFASIQTETPSQNHANLESATMAIQGANGMTKLHVSLVCEKNNDWKINVPASLTAQKLRDNLTAQLTEADNQSSHWPASQADAYRLVARHVMAAILDKSMPAAHDRASAAPLHSVQPTPAATATPAATTSHNWYQFWNW